MIRARQAMLIVAGGLLLSSTGCMNLRDRMQCWRPGAGAHGAMDCTCTEIGGPHGAVPTGLEGAPVLVPPDAMMTPPPPPPQGTQVPPLGPPPRIIPLPATQTPWRP